MPAAGSFSRESTRASLENAKRRLCQSVKTPGWDNNIPGCADILVIMAVTASGHNTTYDMDKVADTRPLSAEHVTATEST